MTTLTLELPRSATNAAKIRLDFRHLHAIKTKAEYETVLAAIHALFDKGAKEMNPEIRAKLYQDAQAILVDDLPVLWLWEKFYPIASRKGVVGLPSGSMHSEVFEGVGWK